jgi:hypothetical protein
MGRAATFHRSGTGELPTLRTIVSYHAYDDAWVPDALAGKTKDEVGRDKHKGGLLRDDPTLPDDLVQGMWDELSPVADQWRQYRAFRPRVAVPDDAPLRDRLLGLTGRDPSAP